MKSLFYISLLLFLTACGVNRHSFSPEKKYPPEQLQKDYAVFQSLLQAHHPGLYWYTSKDSMDYYFSFGKQQLKDSMTEAQFRKVLSWIAAKVNCGHTTVRSSKRSSKYFDTARLGRMFPLSVKVWSPGASSQNDTMVVTANLNRRDSILKRGMVITAINNRPVSKITDTLFEYISTDGYNTTHKFQMLSNRGNFGSLYSSVFGVAPTYKIDYIDSTGKPGTTVIPVYNPVADTTQRRGTRTFRTAPAPEQPRLSKRQIRLQRLNAIRLLKIDTVNRTAMMDLASFAKNNGLRKFFRQSFKTLQQNKISHLIIDVRSNGGGSVSNSTLLTKYLANSPFKIADSLYAVRKNSTYQRYIEAHFWNKLFILLLTKKKADGNYHFGYFENKYFNPKTHNHYDGKVYVLTGGNSFSATTLFATALKKQENVTMVGEETGGGAYGNSAWLIPDVTLPETHIRFRLPLFRLVIDKTIPKNGKGVQPEVFSLPTVEAVRRNSDFKLDTAMELIKKDKASRQ